MKIQKPILIDSFQGPQKTFCTPVPLENISMLVWCFKGISDQYISSTQSQALGSNPAPRELIGGPQP